MGSDEGRELADDERPLTRAETRMFEPGGPFEHWPRGHRQADLACPACGVPVTLDPSWRWNGQQWGHRCAGSNAQAAIYHAAVPIVDQQAVSLTHSGVAVVDVENSPTQTGMRVLSTPTLQERLQIAQDLLTEREAEVRRLTLALQAREEQVVLIKARTDEAIRRLALCEPIVESVARFFNPGTPGSLGVMPFEVLRMAKSYMEDRKHQREQDRR